MKKLLITLLLISPFSFADWGDVYYCQMTNNIGVTLEGERANYTLERFTFKLDKTKQALVFGKDGYFDTFELFNDKAEERAVTKFYTGEEWLADGKRGSRRSTVYYNNEKFLYGQTGTKSFLISADCDKLE